MSDFHVVDTSTGEVHEDCESCALLRDQLTGANKDIMAWRARYAHLLREVEAQEALDHEHWNDIKLLFKDWQSLCGHPRTKFTVERFRQALPFFKREGMLICRRAIKGAAFDPYTTVRKNGSVKRHDDWGLIFRDDKFEEMTNRAPREKE